MALISASRSRGADHPVGVRSTNQMFASGSAGRVAGRVEWKNSFLLSGETKGWPSPYGKLLRAAEGGMAGAVQRPSRRVVTMMRLYPAAPGEGRDDQYISLRPAT